MINVKQIIINGIETNYAVSEDGIVINTKTNHIIKPKINEDDYAHIKLHVNGKRVYKFVHVLVATAYIPNPLGLPQVNHKDGDHLHNHYTNLEWCDAKYNVHHSIVNRLRKNIRLSDAELFRLMQLMSSGKYTQDELANMFNVPRHIITSIKNKQSWTMYSDMFHVENCKTLWNLTPNEKVIAICEMICENKLMLDEIAEIVGISHSVVCDIYHKRNFKSIVSKYDFSNYDKYQRYDKNFLNSIRTLIMSGKSNKEIISEMNLEKGSKTNTLLYRQRLIVEKKR